MNIYASGNPQGFMLNISHPKIAEYYRRFKAWKGLPQQFPITNEQRREFERYMFDWVLSK